MTTILKTVFALCFTFNVALASDFLVVEGKLVDSGGINPIEDASVDFVLSIYDDTVNNCLLYKETFSALDMSGTKGFFSLKLGKGSVVTGNFLNSMNNKFNHTGLTCSVGTTYNPTAVSSRKLEISYNNGGGLQTLSQRIDIGASQYANYAYSLEGKTAVDFIQVNTTSGKVLTQANLESVFANASNQTELMALINGTSSQYNSGSPVADVNMNSQKVVNVAAPTLGTDATNKNYVDNKIGGVTADNATITALGVGQSGQVLTWSGTQWTSSAPSGDSTKLPLAGGTMTGILNMGAQNITNSNNVTVNNDLSVGNDLTVTSDVMITGGIGVGTGINSGGTISVDPINTGAGDGGRLSLKELAANGTNSVSLRAPDALAADVIFTLPVADGTNGQVLSTDGSGVLSWISSAAPVTSIFGRTGVVVGAASDYNSAQIDNTPAGNIVAINVQTAINELDTEKLAKSGDTMSGDLMIGQTNELRLGDADDSNYIGFVSPAILGSNIIWELPSVDGSSGQVLQTNGVGQLSWISQPASGEANTATNQGAGGIGVFKQKTGIDLEFRNINSANTKVVVSLDGVNNEIDIDVNEANFTLTNGNIWVGNGSNQAGSVTMGGDASISNTGALTIANSAISSAKILDASIADIDINASAAIARSKVANGTPNRVLVNNGSGALVDATAISANRALTSDANGIPIHSAVTSAELGYVSGVTSAIQTQLDSKFSSSGGALSGALTVGQANQIRFSDADDSNYVSFKSPAVVSSNVSWTLPDMDGTSGQMLQTDGSGNLSWNYSPPDDLGNHMATMNLDMSNNSLLNLPMGLAATPSISFNGDANTGIFSPLPDAVSLSTNGQERIRVTSNGNIGVGLTSPSVRFDINGAIKFGAGTGFCNSSTLGSLRDNGGGFIEVCTNDSANPSPGYNWHSLHKSCPSTWTWIGVTGAPTSLCISPQQTATNYNASVTACLALDSGIKPQLCTVQQLQRYRSLGALPGTTLSNQVIFETIFKAVLVDTNATPNSTTADLTTGSYSYYCCID